MQPNDENGGVEYGVGEGLSLNATSLVRRWFCDECGACETQKNEPPRFTPRRPKNWVQVNTFTSKGLCITELCDKCATHIKKLVVWDE